MGIWTWRLGERQSNTRLAISWYQWNIISSKEEDDKSYHEIHPKQQKRFIYIYIYEIEDWERDNQIWDWQFHDINEILYRQKKKRRYFISWDTFKAAKMIYIYKWRLRERQSNMRLAIWRYQWNIISLKKEDDISYHEIHPKQQKRFIYIYIYENEDWEKDNQIWDWQFHDINEILYRQRKKKDDISYHEIHSKQQKWYIYI